MRPLALLLLCVLAPVAHAQTVQRDFERLAESTPFLIHAEFLRYGRTLADHASRILDHEVPPAAQRAYNATFDTLATADYPTADVVKLLSHADPKVRTLALLRLFTLEDGRLLPHIATLTADDALTFGELERLGRSYTVLDKLDVATLIPPLKALTVGQVSRAALSVYLETVGINTYRLQDDPAKLRAVFDDHWAARKDRAHCVGWSQVRYERARQGISPVRESREPIVRALRRDIDKLPEFDRTLVLLSLVGNLPAYDNYDWLVTEADLIAMCKKQGDKLLPILAAEPISDDPDLQLSDVNRYAYRPLVHFLLRHGARIFTPAVCDKLLEWEQLPHNRDYHRSPYWSITAAELQPRRASEILRPALKGDRDGNGEEHGLITLALWRLSDGQHVDELRDWYYRAYDSQYGAAIRFLGEAVKLHPVPARKLVAEIVRDKRFADLPWVQLEQVIRLVNEWSAQDIVSNDELEATGKYVEKHRFERDLEANRKREPVKTANIERTLVDWRACVRRSVPLWADTK